jgi:hypothetical protein
MDYRKSSEFRVFVAALAVAALGIASATAGGKAEKIQFSEPSAPAGSTNLTRLNPNGPNSREGEEDLLKSFRSVKGGSSLDDIFNLNELPSMPQPNQPRPLSKRALEELDRRKNWAFTDLNDLNSPNAMDGVPGLGKSGGPGPDDQVSLMEKYYQSGGQNGADGKKPGAKSNPFDSTRDKLNKAQTDFDPYATAFKNSDPFFEKMMTGESGEPQKKQADERLLTAAPVSFAPDAETKEQQRRLAEFRHNMDPSYPLLKPENSVLAFDNLLHQAQPPAAAAGSNAPSLFQHTSISPATAAVDPNVRAFHSRVYDDPTATALGLPQKPLFPTATPPPPPPTAQSIQALTDPFGANAPRRKF